MPRFASLALFFALAAGCQSSLPAPDSCVAAGPGTVDALQIGPSESFMPWHPLADGDAPSLAIDESSRAFIFRIDVVGSPPPDCLAQSTVVTVDGKQSSDHTPRRTYPIDDGSRVTHDLWIPIDGCCSVPPGFNVEVTVTSGQQSVTRHLVSSGS